MKKTMLFASLVVVSAISSAAIAASQGAYVGLGAGYSNLSTPKIDDQAKENQNEGDKFTRSTGGFGGRAFVGYNLNQYFGLEAGYARYASSNYDYVKDMDNAKIAYKQSAIDLVAKAYLPIQESGFSIYALGGVAYTMSTGEKESWKTPEDDKTAVKTTKDASNSAFLPKAGIGVSYDIPETNLTTSVEYSHIFGKGEMVNKDKMLDPIKATGIPSANLVTLNLAYNFS